MRFGGNWTEIHCHNHRVDRYIKVRKENDLLCGLVKVPFRSHDDRFYRYIGVNFTFGLLDYDRFIGDIVIPRIVKLGFCSIHFTVTLARLKNINHHIGIIVIQCIEDHFIRVPL